MVLKSSIRTSALLQWQRSDWGLRVTQDAYFSLLSHTKQLLLVTFFDTTVGIGASFRTDARTDGGGRTDRHGSQNSYLDEATGASKVVVRPLGPSEQYLGRSPIFITGLRVKIRAKLKILES